MLRVAAGVLATGCMEAEAKARADLIDVGSYSVFLDLATDRGTVRSRAEIRFRCREPGAANAWPTLSQSPSSPGRMARPSPLDQ
jgi:hypothetical protein